MSNPLEARLREAAGPHRDALAPPDEPIVTSELASLGPIVTGATGGSGTRLLALILQQAGVYLGTGLNKSQDAEIFGRFAGRWVNRLWASPPSEFLEDAWREIRDDFRDVVETHVAPIRTSPMPWGWKEPRSLLLLPFLESQFPHLRFLHFVRDGRDMALSTNQNQLILHGAALLPASPGPIRTSARSMALWSLTNLRAADYGEHKLGTRYLRVRFEDLCLRPTETVSELLAFLDLDADVEQLVQDNVRPPKTLERWRKHDAAVVAELHRIGGEALRRFGYLDT